MALILSSSTTGPKKVQTFRIDIIHKAKKFKVLPLAIYVYLNYLLVQYHKGN